MNKKIVFAAGGSGGHLFPAQALAVQLKEKEASLEILFVGAGLSATKYFDREKFAYANIDSATPYASGVLRKLQNVYRLLKGIFQSIKVLSKERPALVIGFGSFHAFPVLAAAVIKRVPLILFESNAIPGKVIRVFSRFSRFTALYFSEAENYLKAATAQVEIPSLKTLVHCDKEKARAHFDLRSDLFTVLIFGGSQGAKKINQTVLELIPKLADVKFQILHFTGNEETAAEITSLCNQFAIPCYVKPFESRMDLAWSAADLALCRAGAATLSEMLHFAIPSLLIPFPHAADQHQLKNAQAVLKAVGGVKVFNENELSVEALHAVMRALSTPASCEWESLKKSLEAYKLNQNKKDLASLVLEEL